MTPQEAIDAISLVETNDQEARIQIAKILKQVQPAAGITLTPEEARLAERALREYGAEPHTLYYGDADAMDALAARLEASA